MKRKNNAHHIIFTLIILFGLNSCLKDNVGNYATNVIQELPLVAGLQDQYLLNVDDILSISYDIEKEGKNTNDYNYKWYYYFATPENGEENPKIEVSTTKDLSLKADMETRDYYLVLEVEDKATAVTYFKKMRLIVKRMTSEGWLLLTYKDNKTNLSIFTPDNEVWKDFLVTSTQYPMSEIPKEIICLNQFDRGQPIAILTGKPQIYFLDNTNFEVASSANEAFTNANNAHFDFFTADMWYMMYYLRDTEGNLYTASNEGNLNIPTGFSDAMLGSYRAGRLLLPTESAFPAQVLVFDEANRRFLYQPSLQPALDPLPVISPSAPFSLDHFTDRILYSEIGMGVTSYIVGADDNNNYSLYQLTMDGSPSILDSDPATSKAPLLIPNGEDPYLFTLSGKLPLLYYMAGNNLYLYKITEKTSVLLYSFPTDETITALEMIRERIPTNPLADTRIGIASNDSNGGIFYIFDLSPTGALQGGTYTSRIDGFDPIVDIAYKENR